MGILEDVKAEVFIGRDCTLCVWLADQSEDDQAQWAQAIESYQMAPVLRALKKHGFRFGDGPLRNHKLEKH